MGHSAHLEDVEDRCQLCGFILLFLPSCRLQVLMKHSKHLYPLSHLIDLIRTQWAQARFPQYSPGAPTFTTDPLLGPVEDMWGRVLAWASKSI